ncbi:Protein of unknown function [Pyronema omphalodes CBS 100304]|uniref:Uncharacterized protein n=1 Tax=Pyronema omphalodes (strain CBS 100304) TaxID=1076935 RepID=U4L559_PYROM|nr:Protein of unknown function [Pyronema omphalodes CBS 100304]
MNQSYPATPRNVGYEDYRNQYALRTSRTHSPQNQSTRALETVQEKVYDSRTSDPDSTDTKIGSLSRTDSGYDSISGPDSLNPSFLPGVSDEIRSNLGAFGMIGDYEYVSAMAESGIIMGNSILRPWSFGKPENPEAPRPLNPISLFLGTERSLHQGRRQRQRPVRESAPDALVDFQAGNYSDEEQEEQEEKEEPDQYCGRIR